MPTHKSVLTLIDGFLKEASADLEKQASNLDLAGDAKSTHPSANVDDKTKPATEGSRSSENEADVKKEVPNTINDASSENRGGSEEAATVQGDQGTATMSSDSGLKGNVDTPKKDHSKSMSDSGPGDDTFNNNWDKASAAAALTGEANKLLADVALLSGTKQAGQKQAAPQAKKEDAQPAAPADGEAQASDAAKTASDDEAVEMFKKAAEQYPEDVEAGYVAAAMLAQQLGLMKEAGAEDETAQQVAAIQKEAEADAENYVQFLQGFAETMEKGAQPMGDPAALAALAGEGDAGGEMGAEEMAEGGEDVGDVEAGEGGEEEALEGGEDQLDAIAAALAKAGVTPEELAAAVAAQGEEGEGEEVEGEEVGEAAPEVV
jgi:hypothetical protein